MPDFVRNALDKVLFALIGPERFARTKGVRLGVGGRIYIRNWGSEPFLIEIGDRVTLSAGVRILTHDGATWLVRDDLGRRRQKYGPVKIGSDVFVGADAILMPGVTLGDRVIVGAGACVTKDIPSGEVWAGNPARRLKSFDDYKSQIEATTAGPTEIPSGIDREAAILEHVARRRALIRPGDGS